MDFLTLIQWEPENCGIGKDKNSNSVFNAITKQIVLLPTY